MNIYKQKNDLYYEFKQYKGRGKFRKIQAPTNELKKIQKIILDKILLKIKCHKSAFGFVKNKTIFENAMLHKDSKWIFTLDIKDFFDSISESMVEKALINNGIIEKKAKTISSICTRNGFLVQGSPSSPQISNIVFKPIDKKIFTICSKNNLIYTRYVDDITISGEYENIDKIKSKIFSLINKAGFKISYKKVHTLGKHRRQNVTGIIVNNSKSVPIEKAMRIRALLYNIKRDIAAGKIKTINDIEKKYESFNKIYGYANFMNDCNKKYEKYLNQAKEIKQILKNT